MKRERRKKRESIRKKKILCVCFLERPPTSISTRSQRGEENKRRKSRKEMTTEHKDTFFALPFLTLMRRKWRMGDEKEGKKERKSFLVYRSNHNAITSKEEDDFLFVPHEKSSSYPFLMDKWVTHSLTGLFD